MRRWLVGLLLIGIAGCGESALPPDGRAAIDQPEDSRATAATTSAGRPQPMVDADPVPGNQPQADKPNAQVTEAESVAALEKRGARIKRNEAGEVLGVDLFNARITDAGLVHLRGLTKLQYLDLGDTRIADAGLVHLEGMANLQLLDFSGTRTTDAGLVHLKGLKKLQTLWLRGTRITDAGLVHLKGMTNLQELVLPDEITDAGLVHLKGLTNLKSLGLGGPGITDAGLVHLKGLSNLQGLLLPDQITNAGVADLKKSLPKCEIRR